MKKKKKKRKERKRKEAGDFCFHYKEHQELKLYDSPNKKRRYSETD